MTPSNLTKSAKFAVMVDTRNSVGQPFCHWQTYTTKKEACRALNQLAFSGQVIRVAPLSSPVTFYQKGY